MEVLLRGARSWTDESLRRWLRDSSGWTPSLKERVLHVMEGGGKALRPALVGWAENLLAGREPAAHPSERARYWGLALEMIHTYSLVHDDLPAMDDDASRRGRPTLHVLHGDAEAILVGDALLTAAFEVMAAYPPSLEAITELARASGGAGMIQGQRRDLGGEPGVEAEAPLVFLKETHRLKTGALFGAAFVLGALSASETPLSATARGRWRDWGVELGLLFQIVDDILDATASTQALGKTAGKDAQQGKRTYVESLGLDEAKRQAVAAREAWVTGRPDGVPEAPARELAIFVAGRLA
jgi:farnesyl diphosphate synthase